MAGNEDEAPDDEDSGEGGNTKGKKMLVIIIAAVVVLLIGGGGAAYFLLFAGDSKPAEATEEASSDEGEGDHGSGDEHGDEKDAAGPVFYEMPEILVNLTNPKQQTSFLKMKITLELKEKKDVKTVEKFLPRITDSFNTYLRELRPSDLAGSAGMYRLREELALRINQTIAPAEIKNILFKEVVVQ